MSGQDVPLDEGDDEPSPECPRTDIGDCRTLPAFMYLHRSLNINFYTDLYKKSFLNK